AGLLPPGRRQTGIGFVGRRGGVRCALAGSCASSVVLGVLLAAGADVFCPLMRFSARCNEAVACVYATILHCPREAAGVPPPRS
ncbi:hypothetical protein, partial [Achromobacter sp. UBA5777]